MIKILLGVAAAAATISAPTLAQDSVSAVRHHGWSEDMTRSQAQQRADQLFDRFDLNHDGVVTRDEAEQIGKQLMGRRQATGQDGAPGLGGHTLRFLENSFAGAQSVTKPQFEAAMLTHFDQMDLNHDGTVTAAERAAARGAR